MGTLLANPAIVALLAGVPSLVLALFGYLRSVRLDKQAEASGIATFKHGAIDQVIDAQNALIESLRKDNQILRDQARQR